MSSGVDGEKKYFAIAVMSQMGFAKTEFYGDIVLLKVDGHRN